MKSIDLTRGSVLKTLVIYSLPLMITNVIQLLFHAADVAVLGIMADDLAVAAVGACGSLISFFISLFTGLSTGVNILIARRVGSKDVEGARRATGTGICIGLISGIILMVIAMVGARDFLILMNCQESVLDDAVIYMRVYFLGMPIIMLYNFVAAILRSVGDSLRPMIYMFVAGILNVGLNVVFIAAFDMTVEGVALATVISNLASLALALIALCRNKDYCKVEIKNLCIRKRELFSIVRVGVPACMGGLSFYFANIIVSSAVNSLSTDAMTASAISGQFDGIIYNIGLAVAVGCMAMVGQAYGANNIARVRKTISTSIVFVTLVSLFSGVVFVLLARPMLGIMTDSERVIDLARSKMMVLCLTYFITSIMEVFSFSLRALHRANETTVVCFICGFLIRVLWVYVCVPYNPNLAMIYLSYPISTLIAIIIYAFVYRNTLKRFKNAAYGKKY
ncbi:MAG: MATE family efflux transporter [Clostridia bacterium]|nr:MATE family efflux transporter [Clostridia bacterium]